MKTLNDICKGIVLVVFYLCIVFVTGAVFHFGGIVATDLVYYNMPPVGRLRVE